MHNVITSRHIRSASELFLMVPIKPGFVPISDVVMTYATRVSTVLNALFELRQKKIELDFGTPTGPIELLQTIHRVQWTVLETHDELLDFDTTLAGKDAKVQMPDMGTQIKGPQLILTSHFTGSWEHYFYDLASTGGPLLDLIFSHCVGYEGHSCDEGRGYEAFSRFIRRHQRPCNFQFAAEPDVTVDDLRYFKNVLPRLMPSSLPAAAARALRVREETQALQKDIRGKPVGPPHASAPPATGTTGGVVDPWENSIAKADWTQNILRAVFALYEIRERLFSDAEELTRLDGTIKSTGVQLYDDAVQSVLCLEPDVDRLRRARNLYEEALKSAGMEKLIPPLPPPAAWLNKLIPPPPPPPPPDDSDAAADRAVAKQEGPVPPTVDAGQVQPNILEDLPGKNPDSIKTGAILLLHCKSPDALCKLVTLMRDKLWMKRDARDFTFMNFGLTFAGLKRAGLSRAVLGQFPREFMEGMAERSGSLGDVGRYNHPHYWQAPWRDPTGKTATAGRIELSEIDAVIVLQAADEAAREREIAALLDVFRSAGISVLHRTDLRRGDRDKDPFGLADKISQPKPITAATPPTGSRDDTALGEFLLGYPDRNGRTAECADRSRNKDSSELFMNGTFLVVRKMMQDADAFKDYVASISSQATPGPFQDVSKEDAVAFLVGRRADGTLLTRLGKQVGGNALSNEFDFEKDDEGRTCPFHSHIRRANPREVSKTAPHVSITPRILRRGMAYGPDARDLGENKKEEVGSMFMAYNANIAEQYEILQRYINGNNSNNASSLQNDLLCGANGPRNIPRWVKTSDKPLDFHRLPDRKEERPFVVLRWGLYLFVPAKEALAWLGAKIAASNSTSVPDKTTQDERSRWGGPQPGDVQRGLLRVRELDALPDLLETHEWKRLLEEVPEAGSAQARQAADVWAAITNLGGVKRVSKDLVVVTSEQVAKQVLGDDGSRFSVSEYGTRMQATIQDHYLAHDPVTAREPSYQDLSVIPNEQLEILTSTAFDKAFKVCEDVLNKPGDLEQELVGPKGTFERHSLSLRDLARTVVGQLCVEWFALLPAKAQPTEYGALMKELERFLLTSRYTFQYAPEEQLKADATGDRVGGKEIPEKYIPIPGKCPFANQLRAAGYQAAVGETPADLTADPKADEPLLRQAVSGAVVGFAPPTVGAIIRVLDQWLENEEFWHLSVEFNGRDQSTRQERQELNWAIYHALGLTPSPPILYRTAARDIRFSELGVNLPDKIDANAKVVVALSAVYTDALNVGSPLPSAWLFGGQHGTPGDGNPPHGCPVRAAGTDVIAAVAAALFKRKNLKRERRFVISYDAEPPAPQAS